MIWTAILDLNLLTIGIIIGSIIIEIEIMINPLITQEHIDLIKIWKGLELQEMIIINHILETIMKIKDMIQDKIIILLKDIITIMMIILIDILHHIEGMIDTTLEM